MAPCEDEDVGNRMHQSNTLSEKFEIFKNLFQTLKSAYLKSVDRNFAGNFSHISHGQYLCSGTNFVVGIYTLRWQYNKIRRICRRAGPQIYQTAQKEYLTDTYDSPHPQLHMEQLHSSVD